jgi:DNA-binding LacI/PurR family transcriptional regulator
MKRPRLKSRTSHLEVLQALRERIVAGELGPGMRLPTHLELCRQFSTTAATTQRALDELASVGFIYARGRAGTFVSERPPHRYRFGLAFPGNPASETHWGSMWQAIDAEARRLNLAGVRDIKTYYDVSDLESPGRRALIDDAHANCLAGMFLVNRFEPELLAKLESAQHRIPLAELSSVTHPGVVHVRIATYISKVLDYLKAQGCKRIGLILSSLHGSVETVWKRLLDERKLRYEPYWIVSVHPAHPEPARKAAYLMLQQPADQRPDALIINDDYLVETATAGVADSGAKAPDAVEVIAHCNFPLPPASRVPVTRIGYDMPALLNNVLQSLDEKAAGRSPKTSEIVIEALFENELDSAAFQTFAGRNSEMETPALPQPAFTFGQF